MRRTALATALCLSALPALAADVSSAWVEQLKLDGYERISIGRTWLGRTRIVAEKGEIEREIIINRRTGEVLRDYSRHEDGSLRLPLGFDVDLDDDEDDEDRDDQDDAGDEEDEEDEDEEDEEDSDDGGEEDEEDEDDEEDEEDDD
ncbi:MAG: hypothetical protein QNJ16_03110 [Rhodobacter sp.]|nr:hypothetical protein [Rhodobacter sp.]